MKKIIFGSLMSAMLVCLFGINFAKADGGIFYPFDHYTGETGQKAFIYYQNGVENLIVSTSYRGSGGDFAWVMPTPSKPNIYKSNVKIFTTLRDITTTTNSNTVETGPLSIGSLSGAPKSQPIEVIEEKTVDIYDTVILKATDDKALAQWLSDHRYTFPADSSSELKSYIDNGWYFTIAKIQDSAVNSISVNGQIITGAITPLRLEFTTNQIIYPMKLTQLALNYAEKNAPKTQVMMYDLPGQGPNEPITPRMDITLYVLTDSKTTQDSLQTKWANWISTSQISDLNNTIAGENWINSSNKLFLTDIGDNINLKDVKDDYIITKTSDNNIFPVPVYKTANFWLVNLFVLFIVELIIVLSPIGLLFILFALLQRYVIKRRWVYILGLIYEIAACIIPLIIILLLIFAFRTESFADLLLESGFIGAILGFLLSIIVGLYFSIKMIKRYKSGKF